MTMAERGYQITDEDVAAIRRLHAFCAHHALSWSMEFSEPDCSYELEIQGAGIGEHAYVKKMGAMAWAIQRCLDQLEAFYKSLSSTREVARPR